MSGPRAPRLDLTLIALAIGAAVEEAAENGARVIVMHLERPEDFRFLEDDAATLVGSHEGRVGPQLDDVLDGTRFIRPFIPSVRRAPPMKRRAQAQPKRGKIAPATAAKPKAPKRRPPIRRKRKP